MINSKTVPCLCSDAGAHPAGDTVTFKATVGFRELSLAEWNVAMWRRIEGITEVADILARLSEFYLLHFIEKWTLVDEKRKPLPVTQDNVRERVIEANPMLALELADVADALYTGTVFVPLVQRLSNSSPTTLTNGSTSAQPNGSSPTASKSADGKPRKRSKRSSTSTSLTGVIATTP